MNHSAANRKPTPTLTRAATKRGKLIARNIWRTPDGGAVIKCSKQLKPGDRRYREEKIKPIDASTSYCIDRRDALEAELEALAGGDAEVPAVDDPRTVAGARAAWLAALVDPATGTLDKAGHRYANLEDESRRWLAPFGDVRLAELTVERLNRQARAWLTEPQPRNRAEGSPVAPRPLSASTVNKSRQALMAIFDHAGLVNVAAKMDRADERKYQTLATLDRGIDPTLVAKILEALPDGPVGRPNAVKIRCRIMAATGFPFATIVRIQRQDLNLRGAKPTVYVRAREKGRGAEPRTLELTTQAAAAFADFERADLFGEFDRRNLRRRFATAVRKARRAHEAAHGAGSWPVPADVRPYDLRHSFLTEAYKLTGDERLVGHLALHAENSIQARRYTRSAVDPRAAAAVAKLSDALAVLDKPAATVTPITRGRRRRRA